MNDSDLTGARTGGWLRHRRVSWLASDPEQRPHGRGQRWLAVVATVAVVALVVIAARLTRSSCRTHSSNPGGAMATIEHAGKVLRYVGDGPWRDPVLDEDDPSIVYLYADQNGGTASWGSYCQATPVARVVSQTASADTTGFAADSALTCRDAVVVRRYEGRQLVEGRDLACKLSWVAGRAEPGR